MRSGLSKYWLIIGSVIGALAFFWVLWRVDYGRLLDVVEGADKRFLILVFLSIAAEQLVRGWKWRQLLHTIRPISTLRLFGAIMAGYFANLLVPLGVSPFVRSWLVGRLESLRMSTVLATAAIDRFVDGVIFAGFVAAALAFAAFPDPGGGIRLGLMIGGAGNLILFSFLLYALARYGRRLGKQDSWISRLANRLPARFADRFRGVMRFFAEGIVWPRET